MKASVVALVQRYERLALPEERDGARQLATVAYDGPRGRVVVHFYPEVIRAGVWRALTPESQNDVRIIAAAYIDRLSAIDDEIALLRAKQDILACEAFEKGTPITGEEARSWPEH
jgi:hypothetical protein